MRAATLSIVLSIDSISCLSTSSMCSGEMTKRARSESEGRAQTVVAKEEMRWRLERQSARQGQWAKRRSA
eukprot:6196306-Pleurochrysis_carterae.AAC.4